MKLFLCSHFSSVGSLIKEEIDNKKVAFIPTASLREGYTGYVGSARKLFNKLGAAVTEIDISTEAYLTIQSVFEDADVIYFRDNCNNLRDRAMIDFLLSTGIRVGELVRLNIDDIDFSERECVVYGKGDKERKAYFDAKTKIHLLNYIESRTDNNIALFVSLNKPHSRLTESGVELRLREMGKKLGVEKVHPHKFRRTMATRAIEKGMPIEQVQKILGHEQIDTTLRYAMVNQNNVKLSHRKYIS